MAKEVYTIASEGNARYQNAIGGRSRNPFASIDAQQGYSAAYRRQLAAEGVNMPLMDKVVKEQRNQSIDDEYKRQVQQLKYDLQEKYPTNKADYNREWNKGIRRLRRLSGQAKKKELIRK